MRLVFVNTIPLWGGGERWTLESARGLAGRGHAVHVLAVEGGKLVERAAGAGLHCTAVPGSSWARRRQAAALGRMLHSEGAEVLVANCGPDVRLASRLRVEGRPALVFRRGLDRPLRDDVLHRRLWRQVDAILANSEATRATVRRSLPWFPEDRLHVLHNPIDVAAFLDFAPRDVRRELGIDPGAFVIGMVGRLSEQKGHRTLLEALPRIVAARPDVQVLFVGAGEIGPRIAEQARRLGVDSHCHFVGHVDVVQPYYLACDAIAIPSRFEGFCYTAVEAQLLGRPVVASNASSLPEIVNEGVTGFLVPAGDVAALAARLLQLAQDVVLRGRLGRAGPETAPNRFAAPAIHAALEDLLAAVSNRARAAAAGSELGPPV